MYEGVEFMGWILFSMVVLILGAEIVDMIASAIRRRRAEGRMPVLGSFSLRPRESKLSKRHFHKVRTSGGSWGGLNKVD